MFIAPTIWDLVPDSFKNENSLERFKKMKNTNNSNDDNNNNNNNNNNNLVSLFRINFIERLQCNYMRNVQ